MDAAAARPMVVVMGVFVVVLMFVVMSMAMLMVMGGLGQSMMIVAMAAPAFGVCRMCFAVAAICRKNG